MIELKNISVEAGEFSLEDISLKVNKGEYFVILGPTGSGKTLLLETIIGICSLKTGRVLINCVDISNNPPEKRNIGFIYQDYMLFPHLNVSENIKFGLKSKKLGDEEIERKLNEIVNLMEIKHLLSRNVRTLSGGEQQKTALARAIVTSPDVLLLDEPLSALDPGTKERLLSELKKIHSEIKTTTIHVTHDFEEAISLADRIAVMNCGRIVQTGTPDEIFRKPLSEFVAKFVGAENLFKGASMIKEGMSVIDLFGMDNTKIYSLTPKEGDVRIIVRPEDVIVSKEKSVSIARNSFRGKITAVYNKGALIKVVVDAEIQITALVTRRSFEELNLNINSEVYVSFKASEVHVF